MNIKSALAKFLANYALPLGYNHTNPLDSLCKSINDFHSNQISQADLLKKLQIFYEQTSSSSLNDILDLDKVKQSLILNNGYKHNINDNNSNILNRLKIQNRKFAILRHLGTKDEFTTNSDLLDNVHWMKGVSDRSFLFRISIVDMRKEDGKENMGAEERIYINPTVSPDDNGYIAAPYINEKCAKSLTF